jgi:riboflavin synthase
MFTGIIQERGIIGLVLRRGGGTLVTVRSTEVGRGANVGDSIAVNGVCLTVTHVESGIFVAQAVEETVERTTLGRLREGDAVNLEPALRPSDRLGGHFVTGHVDGVGIIRSRDVRESSLIFALEVPGTCRPYIVAKGSVALDGVSLTVVDVLEARAVVSVIPLTAETTTFGSRRVGDEVNVEVDILGKYVERFVGGKRGPLDEKRLKEMGY